MFVLLRFVIRASPYNQRINQLLSRGTWKPNTEVVQFNVVMVGNSCVGKTSFIRRFHEDQFTEDYRSTIGECCYGGSLVR
uniref:Uncharacterized protein n=1 Tax=Sinocyclocheilus grahami TaxID=75366 RepID=A0A672P6E6_SINGR